MAIALDGPDAPTQARVRNVGGTFDRAVFALQHAREIGLDTQVQTTVTKTNLDTLAHIAEQVADAQAKMWTLFFLVTKCDGSDPEDLTSEEYERVFEFLYEISKVAPFEVKTTEGPQYRRYIAQKLKEEHGGRGRGRSRSAGIIWKRIRGAATSRSRRWYTRNWLTS